ncbi:MAG: hypothetical protein WCH77_12950 [Planctomycetota bacterium]
MPLKLGSSGPLVKSWQETMVRRFGSYAKEANGTPLKIDAYYGYSDERVQREYQRRTRQSQTGIVTDYDLAALGLIAEPPKPAPKHGCLTFRGTGGIVGLDYTSRVAAASPVTEIPVPYAASMGPLPVGSANDLQAPSGSQSRDAAVEWAARWIESTTKTFMLCGYSQGADAASRVRAMLEPGQRLERHRDRYVCGVMFGNPTRRFGHTFYMGAVPDGEGIADWHIPESACTWDWLELVQPGDLYANVPLGDVGDVCRQAYRLIMNLQFTDPGALASAFLQNLMSLLDEAGVDPQGLQAPDRIINGFIGGFLASLAPQLGPLVNTNTNREAAAAAQAAMIGLRFATTNPPTAPHITYEWAEALPGMTYLQLAIQHVAHWSKTKPVKE